MYRSTNRQAQPLQVALFGAPCTGRDQFSALLGEALKADGLAAEVAMPVALNVPFKADAIFLMGLHSTHAEDVDADIGLRQLLVHHKLPYQVLYGSHRECLVHAMDLIHSHINKVKNTGAVKAAPSGNRTEPTRPWVWVCDKCSDPQCEHQLLTGLLASRSPLATGQLP